ncbi:MAG TPA: (d)CMP kinase [Candidatus Brocadiia bacterium]
MIVAIDGPAASGKSTVAKRLAKHLNFKYLDTGALYRALTLKAIESQVDLQDESALSQLMDNTSLELQSVRGDEVKVLLDGRDVSKEIRQPFVTNLIHHIAGSPSVRKKMVQLQRKIARGENTVAEGRDVGTIVFPNADKKFYLDADVQERAKRRLAEAKQNDNKITVEQIAAELNQRDYKDIKRAVSPLKRANDAIYIDTTNLTVEEVVKTLLEELGFLGSNIEQS